ncbi:MAG: DUF4942 domain-containing protein [Acidithiobacillus ferrivorans]
MFNSDVILTTSISEILEKREQINAKVKQAMEILSEACSIERSVTGVGYSNLESYFSGHHYVSLSNSKRTQESLGKYIDAAFWRSLLDASGIRAVMSAKKQKDIDSQISDNETPPFEAEAIASTFADLYEKRASMMEDGVVDVFRSLSWDYNTNNPVAMGRKIIINSVLDSYGTANTWRCDMLDDLIRILSVYDGKAIPEHRHGMYSLVSDAIQNGSYTFDCAYFSAKLFKKGSCHITFNEKSIRLLDLCNRAIARRFPASIPHHRRAAA